jgi:HEAT repeat protein
MPQRVVKNARLRSPVTVIEEAPDLSRFGRAGIRMKLDSLLSTIEGRTARDWRGLSAEEREVLRLIAREEDPAWGVSHQVDAIGALAELRDEGALLQLSQTAQDGRADLRLRVAATYALGAIGGDAIRPVLHALLKARAPEVRAQAAKSLARAGGAADVAALETLAGRDQTFVGEVARNAAEALQARLRLRREQSPR